MKRVMIIPAAGLGSRLGSETPKVLYRINGRAMIDYLFDLYASYVECFVLVVSPNHASAVKDHCRMKGLRVEFTVQSSPTGMLDAILAALPIVEDQLMGHHGQVWITWADQIAVHHQTVKRLAVTADENSGVVMPTVIKMRPYIHWVRNDRGEIISLLQQREGDHMPDRGEGDLGLFSLSKKVSLELLPQFAAKVNVGNATGERNFLPFITWVTNEVPIETFAAENETESVGVNTLADVALIENYLNGEKEAFGNNSSL